MAKTNLPQSMQLLHGGSGVGVVDRPTRLFYIWIFICCKYTNLKDTAGQSARVGVAGGGLKKYLNKNGLFLGHLLLNYERVQPCMKDHLKGEGRVFDRIAFSIWKPTVGKCLRQSVNI